MKFLDKLRAAWNAFVSEGEWHAEAICPYCGWPDKNTSQRRDTWLEGDSDVIECESCEKAYDVHVSVDISFQTEASEEVLDAED